MRLLIGFDADIPDAVAEGLLRGAGVQVPLADVPLALALVVIQPFRDQVRDLLLSPEHEPVPFDQPTLLTTDRSANRDAQTLTTPDKDHPLWTKQPADSSTKPQRKTPPRKGAASGSRSKSKRTKPSAP